MENVFTCPKKVLTSHINFIINGAGQRRIKYDSDFNTVLAWLSLNPNALDN